MRSRALPKYRQIAEGLRAEIAAGRYAPGDRLPSVVELIAGNGVALGTVLKAAAREMPVYPSQAVLDVAYQEAAEAAGGEPG